MLLQPHLATTVGSSGLALCPGRLLSSNSSDSPTTATGASTALTLARDGLLPDTIPGTKGTAGNRASRSNRTLGLYGVATLGMADARQEGLNSRARTLPDAEAAAARGLLRSLCRATNLDSDPAKLLEPRSWKACSPDIQCGPCPWYWASGIPASSSATPRRARWNEARMNSESASSQDAHACLRRSSFSTKLI